MVFTDLTKVLFHHHSGKCTSRSDEAVLHKGLCSL